MAEETPAYQEIVATAPKSSYFKIGNFRSEIWNRGISSPNRYLVSLSPFSVNYETSTPLSEFLNNFKDTFIMRCESATIPGVNIMTSSDIRRYGYGPVEHVAHGVSFNDITLTWIVDKNGLINRFFHDWTNTIVNYNSAGGLSMSTPSDLTGFDPYEVGYKDEYSNYKMTIYVYDEKEKTTMEYSIFDVFPKSVMDISLNWGELDSYIRLSVNFGFTDMQIKKVYEFDFDYAESSVASSLLSYTAKSLITDQAKKVLNGIL